MTIAVKPKFQSAVADDPAATAAGEVTPTRWNDGSEISLETSCLIGRLSTSVGLAEELTDAQVKNWLGLGSAAYTASSAYATTAQGATADGALQRSGGTMTGTLTLTGAPSGNNDAATKAYVDTAVVSLAKKFDSVRVATTANITISSALNNGDVIDGVTLATGDLVLVKNQTTASQNGIYTVAASPARAPAFDAWDEIIGSFITVQEGTANADTGWLNTSNKGGTLGSTAVNYVKANFSGELLAANNLSDVANPATAFANIKQLATDSATGVVELSTDAEMTAGTASDKVPTVKQVTDKIAAGGAGLGIGQSWQTVTRVLDTSYQNTTGKPIEVSFRFVGGAARTVTIQVSTNNSTWVDAASGSNAANVTSGVSAVIPNNHYYQITSSGSLTTTSASELR